MKTACVDTGNLSLHRPRHHAEPVHRLWLALRSHEPTADWVHAEPGISGDAGRNGNERFRRRHAISPYRNAFIDEDAVSTDWNAIRGQRRNGHVQHEYGRHAADDDGNAAATSTNRHVEFQRNEQWHRILGLRDGHVVSADWYEQHRRREHELLVLECASPFISARWRHVIEAGAADDRISWSVDCTAHGYAA